MARAGVRLCLHLSRLVSLPVWGSTHLQGLCRIRVRQVWAAVSTVYRRCGGLVGWLVCLGAGYLQYRSIAFVAENCISCCVGCAISRGFACSFAEFVWDRAVCSTSTASLFNSVGSYPAPCVLLLGSGVAPRVRKLELPMSFCASPTAAQCRRGGKGEGGPECMTKAGNHRMTILNCGALCSPNVRGFRLL